MVLDSCASAGNDEALMLSETASTYSVESVVIEDDKEVPHIDEEG